MYHVTVKLIIATSLSRNFYDAPNVRRYIAGMMGRVNEINAHRVDLAVVFARLALVQSPRALRAALVVRGKRLFFHGTVQRRAGLASAHHRRVGTRALRTPVRVGLLARRRDLISEQTSSSRRVH